MKSVEWVLTRRGDKWLPGNPDRVAVDGIGIMCYDQILRFCSMSEPQTTEELRTVFKWNALERRAYHDDVNNPLENRKNNYQTAILFEDCDKNLEHCLKVLERNGLVLRIRRPPEWQK